MSRRIVVQKRLQDLERQIVKKYLIKKFRPDLNFSGNDLTSQTLSHLGNVRLFLSLFPTLSFGQRLNVHYFTAIRNILKLDSS